MNEEKDIVLSAEKLSQTQGDHTVTFIGKAGRVVAVGTILTFSLVGPLLTDAAEDRKSTENGYAQASQNVNLEEYTDNVQPLSTISCPDFYTVGEYCKASYISCSFMHSVGCALAHTICPVVYCSGNYCSGGYSVD